ncbi:ATP synthase F1, gamma subunit [Ehrlichia chaffeensis str. Heartland]|nr:ATP synthase F1, gamma subunit [Ehrlichia chaffeensis str. Heartland]AHX06537.1 ATP synthase F1, gamma subunit [Ehrlichia chaffeensis str. Liberty]AHX09126.1 ATP synthase F1, gamma subunit [Ehrlichia chaffeensis str. Wakulla]AHX10687.1 ATP synthase F1, gamma subunit [Ehrlichia chaffeensis str. West Paces]
MISAAKLHRVQQKLENAKKHLLELSSIVDYVPSDGVHNCASIAKKERVLLVVMSSDRGLCGNFNNLIVKFTKSYVEKLESSNKEVKLIFFGKKAYDMMYSQYSDKILNVFSNTKSITDFLYFKLFVYNSGIDFDQFDNVMILFNKFYTTILQKPDAQQLIPCNLGIPMLLKEVYQYEPTYVDVLSTISLGYVLNLMYIAFLENSASEHCSRMVAMESANRNTKDMLNRLALEYNRSRQASITTDLIEIISGFESLN